LFAGSLKRVTGRANRVADDFAHTDAVRNALDRTDRALSL
jgi:hypothetical protein